MFVKVPDVDIQKAGLAAISVGQVAIGPITVGELVLSNADFSMSGARGTLRNVNVTITLHFTVDWHVHVGMPDGIPDINIGTTYDLGSFTFSAPVGDVVLPALNNIHVHIPTLSAQNMSVAATPLANLQLANAAAEHIQAQQVTLPAAGFTIAGLTLNSIQGTAISVPAATVDRATVGRLHGDPVTIPSFTLGSLQLPAAQIPELSSSAPLDIPAKLQARSLGFDAGILRLSITVTPSALSHIDQLEINGANANATVEQVVLHNVVLPYDVLNLTLSQVGIDSIGIPTLSAT